MLRFWLSMKPWSCVCLVCWLVRLIEQYHSENVSRCSSLVATVLKGSRTRSFRSVSPFALVWLQPDPDPLNMDGPKTHKTAPRPT